MEPKDRLRQAMEAATGMTVATDVWSKYKKVLGVGKDLFISNLNGNRAISKKSAAKYAEAFGVSAGWLLYGDPEGTDAGVGIGEVMALADRLTPTEQFELVETLLLKLRPSSPPVSKRARRASRPAKAM